MRRAAIQAVLGALLAGALGGCAGPAAISRDEAAARVKALFEVTSLEPVEVTDVRAEGNFWRVGVRVSREGAPAVVFLTLDGSQLADGVTDRVKELERLEAGKRFTDCLGNAGVTLFGMAGTQEAQEQLALLGPGAARLFIDCSANPENCRRLGVERLPATRHQEKVTPGTQQRTWFETLTGCK